MRKLFMRMMVFHMLGMISKKFKIFYSIIAFIFKTTFGKFCSVMMHNFFGCKKSSQIFFHDKNTSFNITFFINSWMRMLRNINISIMNKFSSFPIISFFTSLSFTNIFSMFFRKLFSFSRFAQISSPFFRKWKTLFSFIGKSNFSFMFFRFRDTLSNFASPNIMAFFRTTFSSLKLRFMRPKFFPANIAFLKHGILLFILIIAFDIILCQEVFSVDQWLKGSPAGTDSASDIDAKIQTNNAALDRLVYLTRVNCAVMVNTSSTLTVLPGTVAIPNSDGSVVRWRRESSSTSVSWSNLDTGSEEASNQYYVYLSGDTDETGFDVVISKNSTFPTGITYYRKIGYFYNNSDSNIVNVGNIKEGDVPNIMSVTGTDDISTTSAAYVDMTDMEIRFVSNGRPVKVEFTAPINTDGVTVDATIDIDGTDKIASRVQESSTGGTLDAPLTLLWLETLSAGAHTIKVQWKQSGGTAYQYGATIGSRVLIITEH